MVKQYTILKLQPLNMQFSIPFQLLYMREGGYQSQNAAEHRTPIRLSSGLEAYLMRTVKYTLVMFIIFYWLRPASRIPYLITYLFNYLLTHLLTPQNRVLLEKLTISQLVKKFPAFYGTRKFITEII